ncbi:predicted protein [Lichtheimia corymbifera JMRC:FSU:9682]|uniref:Uncharacterized protein n=1 Tax=Lichtheimia corymbifera JMRC:FSU:9682 TaxID=1263082 RepID=A0A068SFA7_9FUNG|nr:predicted protein [Lichtheimia corymbifera JMRC:FSU:9682]
MTLYGILDTKVLWRCRASDVEKCRVPTNHFDITRIEEAVLTIGQQHNTRLERIEHVLQEQHERIQALIERVTVNIANDIDGTQHNTHRDRWAEVAPTCPHRKIHVAETSNFLGHCTMELATMSREKTRIQTPHYRFAVMYAQSEICRQVYLSKIQYRQWHRKNMPNASSNACTTTMEGSAILPPASTIIIHESSIPPPAFIAAADDPPPLSKNQLYHQLLLLPLWKNQLYQ